MSTIHATGISVRHAVSRALATANLTPLEATYQILTARVELDRRARVVRGEVSVRLRRPESLRVLPVGEQVGWVNPDGEHPLMTLIPLNPDGEGVRRFVYLDVYPVTWDAWLRVMDDHLPDEVDPLCPVTGVSLEQAAAYAGSLGRRLPRLSEFEAAWGEDAFPWGPRPDPRLGRVGRPRFDQLPPVGLHPPSSFGVFDLGAWLWQWMEDGRLGGAAEDEGIPLFRAVPDEHRWPVGFRCVAELDPAGAHLA